MTYQIETPQQLKTTQEYLANFKRNLAYWKSKPKHQTEQRIQEGIYSNARMVADLEDQIKTYLDKQPSVDYHMTLTTNTFQLQVSTLEEGQQFLTWLEWGGHEELAEEVYLKQLAHDLNQCRDKEYFVNDLQRQVNNIAQYVAKGNNLQHVKLRAYSKFLRKNALGIIPDYSKTKNI